MLLLEMPRNRFTIWVSREDWTTFVLAAGSAVVVIASVETAQWVETSSLVVTSILGALTSLIAIRLVQKNLRCHIYGLAIGFAVIYIQSSSLVEASDYLTRFGELNERLWVWIKAFIGNGISADSVPFAVILSAISWSTGYFLVWSTFRLSNVWIPVIPSSIILFINITYLPESHFNFVFPFLLLTLLLVARLTSLEKRGRLKASGIHCPSSFGRVWIAIALAMSSIIIGLVFLLPITRIKNDQLAQVWDFSREPASLFQEEFGRMFSAIENKKDTPQIFGRTLPVLSKASVNESPVFIGTISSPTYWKARAYTSYTSGGWTTDSTVSEVARSLFVSPEDLGLEDEPEEIQAIGVISFKVELALSSKHLYIPQAGLESAPIEVKVETHDGTPVDEDIIAIIPVKRIKEDGVYSGTVRLPIYTESAIRQSGEDYPEWVKKHYLDLPKSLPSRVASQTTSIVKGQGTAYEKALAIEAYLRSFQYTNTPPEKDFDEDVVDHFIFESRAGHSDHFASAMAVMLRATGIPSRLIAGFGPGTVDLESRTFVIKEKDKHSWVEAYFPGHGWVPFEPSATFETIPRTFEDYETLSLSPNGATSSILNDLTDETTRPSEEGKNEDLPGGRISGGEGGKPPPLYFTAEPFGYPSLVFTVIVFGWVAILWIIWRKWFSSLPNPKKAYSRMLRLYGLIAESPDLNLTPMEISDKLSKLFPEAREEINYICHIYSKSTYGNSTTSIVEVFHLSSSWKKVKRSMLRYSLG
ncbi:transglutaminase domain-containing protein [SAR202 cluster bacterium AD-493-K16_JPT_193m]|nr:transglutaminase domain-containing protein [SAR202 cluster bacterium AD-493-K16_JPT_193m]